MKKIYFGILLCTSSLATIAQPYYFWHTTETYSPLVGGTSVNGTTVWNGFDVFNVPIGFSFDFMDASFTSFDFEATGRVIFDAGHYYFADMIVVNGLQDKGAGTSLSPISYELTGSPGTQIFKLQVSNATFSGDLTATVDFQIWMYEQTSLIELHAGPGTIPVPGGAFSGTGPSSGVFHVSNWAPLTYDYGLMTYGIPAWPDDTIFTGTGINTFDIYLDGWPAEDQVYSYGVEAPLALEEKESNSSPKIWPNPVHRGGEFFVVEGVDDGCEIEIYDMMGVVKLRTEVVGGKVDVGELTPGVWMVVGPPSLRLRWTRMLVRE
jgi:hypothetical protein